MSTDAKVNPFSKATKQKSKLRAAVFGIAGSGKTFSALSIASGMGGKIAAIDTEHGSMSKYSDRFSFDVLELTKPFSIEKYVQAIRDAEKNGYDVLIIDSLSHAWQELVAEVEKLAETKYHGNTFRAWGEGTPRQREFIDALLSFRGHVIATMRSKTEYVMTETNGKKEIKRAGLSAEQGKNIEYEFDVLLEMSEEHTCRVLKDRSGKFQDRLIPKPGAEFGAELKAWLDDGSVSIDTLPEDIKQHFREHKFTRKQAREFVDAHRGDVEAMRAAIEIKIA